MTLQIGVPGCATARRDVRRFAAIWAALQPYSDPSVAALGARLAAGRIPKLGRSACRRREQPARPAAQAATRKTVGTRWRMGWTQLFPTDGCETRAVEANCDVAHAASEG